MYQFNLLSHKFCPASSDIKVHTFLVSALCVFEHHYDISLLFCILWTKQFQFLQPFYAVFSSPLAILTASINLLSY